jgi:hypothetical protein
MLDDSTKGMQIQGTTAVALNADSSEQESSG